MTASTDRRVTRRRPRGWRTLRLLLAIALLAPAFAVQAPVPAVRADGLSDAIAEQQRLAKLIADQKAQLAKLATKQTSLASEIASTKQNRRASVPRSTRSKPRSTTSVASLPT